VCAREGAQPTTIGRAELRPDFVVESGRGALVLDAKYRRGVGREDIERLITTGSPAFSRWGVKAYRSLL
jgi:5-methylcytosine-specific restriction endonuclease McrBC regulatory subunit McrC